MSPAKRRLCERCHERAAIDRGPTCRRCARELGDTSTLFEREAASVARLHARYAASHVPAADLTPRPEKTITIDDEEWIIVWDGT